jgi:alkylated DNA repair dioxygenase AlkB
MEEVKQKGSTLNEYVYFDYFTRFLEKDKYWYAKVMSELELEQNQVIVFGKSYLEPRLTAIHGLDSVLDKNYVYSKSTRKLRPMTPTLKKIRDVVEFYTEIPFDFVLINFYRTGGDKVGWHSDDEPMMDCSNIVSISLGGERIFKFRDKKTKELVWKESLESGSLLWMKKGCQENLEHEVPKTAKIVEPRLNLTFRKFK